MDDGIERTWRPAWPCPVGSLLRQQRRGPGDPTQRADGARTWRGVRTPEGPATLCVEPLAHDGTVHARAWGAGAAWALEQLPALLGAEDDVSSFEPRTPLVADAWLRTPHWRLGRTGLVHESLLPSILEQKVTGQEAFASFRRLVRRFGEPAPGPGADVGLLVQPAAETVARIPSWEWLQLGVDGARSTAAVRCARVADSLQRVVDRDPGRTDAALQSVPGIGVWTSAEVRMRVLGDADAVSYGDYHLATQVGWALGHAAFTDQQMADYLAPWEPQRGRVAHLLRGVGMSRPRRGPRMAPRTHLPVRRR
ncbi:DNA-3-methyladenine glycosylase 2 family protein [Nocardioides daphniae]|uniref:DNA-3-methyladenine glycosylase 2 family protein n=1 Tax=Nocardioides daphniae TaxID=402297 RepID=A0A4P7UEG8_9ACTN|nr:DNA-3-methyladenine glycosylase 2 family protein [Nocardioides daphniae]